MGRKVWKRSPKRCIILCYSLVGEPWHDTYQVYVQLHNFGNVALLSWSQRHHQCWQSLPSPLGVFPPCPWLRTPFQPSRSISPLWSGAATRAVFIFPQPCLATGLTDRGPAMVPVHPHPQGGGSWSGFLAEPDCSLWVCPSWLREDRGAGPLQSGWDSPQISNEHLTFCT